MHAVSHGGGVDGRIVEKEGMSGKRDRKRSRFPQTGKRPAFAGLFRFLPRFPSPQGGRNSAYESSARGFRSVILNAYGKTESGTSARARRSPAVFPSTARAVHIIYVTRFPTAFTKQERNVPNEGRSGRQHAGGEYDEG